MPLSATLAPSEPFLAFSVRIGYSDEVNRDGESVPLWKPLVFAAMAGGMGWGIRGQYGHETGAMIAGLLVALVLA